MSNWPRIQKRCEAVLSATNTGETDLYLYGYVMDSPGVMDDNEDIICAKEVREALLGIKSEVINVHINSRGGSAFDGIAIHNMLQQHPAKIVVYVDGIAASAASLIAMAADKIIMPENTVMLVHRAATFAFGNAEELMDTAAELQKLDSAVFGNYKARFVGTDEELSKLIAKGAHLTAAECYQLGFCDEVLEVKKSEEAPKKELLDKYKKELKLTPAADSSVKHTNTGELMFELLKNMGGKKQ